MLISIEDYLARRRSRACVASYRVAAAGNAETRSRIASKSVQRGPARVYVLPVMAPAATLPMPAALELEALFAEATLV